MSKPGKNPPGRIKTLAGLVSYERFADIGCDHGLLTAYLLTGGSACYAVASDINPGPLKAAELTFSRLGLLDRVSLRLGGGLSVLTPGEVDSCVIAGMGGMNIIGMLQGSPDITGRLKQLILSPERDMEALRRYLHVSGFFIANEIIILEGHSKKEWHFYFAIDARPGKEEAYDRAGYMFGRKLLDEKDPVLLCYLRKEEKRLERLISSFKGFELPETVSDYMAVLQIAIGLY